MSREKAEPDKAGASCEVRGDTCHQRLDEDPGTTLPGGAPASFRLPWQSAATITTQPGAPSMLSCFNHVRLFAALWAVARQALLSMGFSRHEY